MKKDNFMLLNDYFCVKKNLLISNLLFLPGIIINFFIHIIFFNFKWISDFTQFVIILFNSQWLFDTYY